MQVRCIMPPPLAIYMVYTQYMINALTTRVCSSWVGLRVYIMSDSLTWEV
jgi:hypothetical protein